LKKIAAFAKTLGAKALVSHCGFIPETPKDPLYEGTREAVREVTECCASNGIEFRFETGQETPLVLLRLIEDIAAPNLSINLDPANLLMYGKANPVDALDMIGPHVHSLHIKDGFYPTNARQLGKEAPIGAGKVDFPALFARLKDFGFNGELIIEREIKDSPEKDKDILDSIEKLKSWGGVI
jgi:L-ribulose-5-phosphate 3-epimerase